MPSSARPSASAPSKTQSSSAGGTPFERPAIIICDTGTAKFRVAALSLLDRALIATHRAGFGPIWVVSEGPLPPVNRAKAWSVPFQVVDRPPTRDAWTLVLRTNVLLQTADLKLLEDQPARLCDRTGRRLPVGLIPPGEEPPESCLNSLPTIEASETSRVIQDAQGAREAESALWRSTTSSSDGWVDRVFNRPVGRPLARWLIHTPVTPNAITLTACALGVASGAFFAVGNTRMSIFAAILLQVSAIIDCIDGDVARLVFKETRIGKWLDLVGDQVVHAAVFAGIAVGLWRSGAGNYVGWLGSAAVIGAILSFLVVLRGMRLTERRPDGGRLQRLVDAATNRDFSVLLLILSWADLLIWFLWLAAIGSHLFWMTLFALQGLRPQAKTSGADSQ